MKENVFISKKDFHNRQKVLENARTTLKQEFIGIDSIIDEVIDNVSSWYNFSEIQDRPLVVNLWGLTGVGKTSLINRLAELIDFKDNYFRFDMGKKSHSFSFSSGLDELCENKEEDPIIIALDEFQHARTVEGPFRHEVGDENSRMVWELIDSGRVQYFSWGHSLWDFQDHINKLRLLLSKGVVVNNGYVVRNKKLFCKEVETNYELGERYLFVDDRWYDTIMDEAGAVLGINLRTDLEDMLLGFNGLQTIKFLYKVIKAGKRPAVKSFTSAIIFILGNLDEAYSMGSNYSVDIDADEFHRESLKIDITKIKKALRARFRDEQIARLGNIHIIYPALNRLAYVKIIKMELDKLSFQMNNITGLEFVMDQSVRELIYNEGVYPVQGARPIFTTINQMIRSNLAFFLSYALKRNKQVDKLEFVVQEHILICNYYYKEQLIGVEKKKIVVALENIRNAKSKEMQAITAVHESGHAILSTILLNEIPESAHSVTADSEVAGFVFSRNSKEYISRVLIVPRIAVILGGYVAEEIVFGKEHLTNGAGSDVEYATKFLYQVYMRNGMGDTPIRYGIPTHGSEDYYHNYAAVEERIKIAIEDALALATKTLREEYKLLSMMASYLSDHNEINKVGIQSYFEKYANYDISNMSSNMLNYRNHLQKIVQEQLIPVYDTQTSVILNRDNEK